MKSSKEMLSSILKTTQMGQIGIRSVLEKAQGTDLRQVLHDQLAEYDTLETDAHRIAASRGWKVEELDPGIRMMTDAMTRMMLGVHRTDSRIAGMMIQGNTRGMIKSLKNLHEFPIPNTQVRVLSNRLLQCEQANIRQMQDFL